MRILVTGGAGFIGSNLIRFLVSKGIEVLNLDKLTYAGSLSSLADLEGNPLHRFLKADICDGSAVTEALSSFAPDGIIHLAAESHVDRSIDGPMEFVRTNVMGTATLLQAATTYWKDLTGEKKASFRFLHVSTDEVYGSLGPEGMFAEKTPYAPRSPYSASKASSDHFVRAWHETYGLPVILTNCSNNYGPYQFPEKLIPVVILSALRGEPIPVYGTGENVRDWLYVEDNVNALLTVLQKGEIGETYNIGANDEMRNIDLVRLLCRILDEELLPSRSFSEQITFVADRPGHDFRYAVDTRKIRSELGWRPVHDRDSGMRSTVRWYLDNRPWWEEIVGVRHSLRRLGRP